MSPSRLVVESIQRHVPGARLSVPEGVPAPNDAHCAACGVGIRAGDPIVWLSFGSTFTDWQYLAAPTFSGGRALVCLYCSAVMGGDYLKLLQSRASAAVFSAAGAWSLMLDTERLDFLLDPPDPPFVACIATTMGQHVVWRTPVTLDRDLLRIGAGRSVITINRPRLLDASRRVRDFTDTLRAVVVDEETKTRSKKAGAARFNILPNHPFAALSRKLDDSAHGVIRPDLLRYLEQAGMSVEIDYLNSLDEGVLWGLSVLNKAKQEPPSRTTLAERFAKRQGVD